MKLDYRDFTNLLLFIAVIILLFIVFIKIEGDGAQCTLNPLEYGAGKLKEANSNEVSCSCTLLGELVSETLLFNHNSTNIIPPVGGSDNVNKMEINFSGLVSTDP